MESVEAGGRSREAGSRRGRWRALEFLSQNRGFALVWAAEALVSLGDKVFFVAVACLVLELTGSSLAMGAVLLCLTLPGVALLVIGGVASDRLPRRLLLLASSLARGILYLALAAPAFLGRPAMGHLFAAALVFGVVESFHSPALSAVVPDLVPARGLLQANSLIEVARNAMLFLGPMLGGALVGVWGPGPAFSLAAAALLLAAGTLALAPVRGRPRDAGAGGAGLLAQVREGLARLARDAGLIVFCVLMALGQFAVGGPVDAVLPRLAKDYLGAGPGGYSLLYSFVGLGSLVSALGLSAMGKRLRRRGLVALLTFMGVGAALAVLPYVGGVVAGSAVMALVGVGVVLFRMTYVTLVQTAVEERLRGRVLGLMFTAAAALSPLSYPVFGALADEVSPAAAFVVGGGMLAVCGLCALGLAGLRRLD